MNSIFEVFFIFSFSIFFFFYLINYSEIFEKLRNAAYPAIPEILRKMLQCSFCFSFWIMIGLCFFIQASLMILIIPVFTMFVDLLFKKLRQ